MGEPEPLMDLAKAEAPARSRSNPSSSATTGRRGTASEQVTHCLAKRDDLRARLAGPEVDSGA